MDTLERKELQKVDAAMPDPEAPTAVPLPTAARPAVPCGYYWHLRQQINAASNAQASSHMWHSPRCKFSAIRTVLNVRHGSLWTVHRARTMGRPYVTDLGTITNGSCPLCLAPLDSAGHLLGECSHHDIKSMHIARHNKAAGLIQDAIASGPLGAATWLWMHVAVTLRLILLPPHVSHPGCCPQCLHAYATNCARIF